MSNTSANSTFVSSSDAPSDTENLICGVAVAIIGFAGILVNAISITVFSLSKNKKLKTPCFVLISGHAVFCWLSAVGYFTNGVHFLGVWFGVFSLSQTRLTCFTMYLWFFTGVPPSSVLIFLISFDRSLSMVVAQTHEKRLVFFAYVCLIVTAIIGLLHAVVGGVTLPKPTSASVLCYNLFSPLHPTYTTYYTNFNLCFPLLSVVNYGAVFGIITYKKRKTHPSQAWSGDEESNYILQRQLKLLPMLNSLMISTCILGVFPPLMSLTLSKVESGRYLQRAGQYAVVLKSSLACMDFFVLVTKSKDFRGTLKKLISKIQSG